jgi:hypothetical protein
MPGREVDSIMDRIASELEVAIGQSRRVPSVYDKVLNAYRVQPDHIPLHLSPADCAAAAAEIGRLRAALGSFADCMDGHEQEHHIALRVGGYVPIDRNYPIEVELDWLEDARR